jgi:hypothetical protein
MKKIALLSPCTRINIECKSIRSLEIVYLKKYLEEQGNIVHYISKKLKELDNDYIDIASINDLNDYDEIYIHNFNTNFFGGLVSGFTINYLKLISNYNGKIFYYITDPKLKYINLANDMLKRKNLKFEIDIDREELEKISKRLDFQELRIDALFTGYNYEPIYGIDFYNVKKFNVFESIAKSNQFNMQQIDIFNDIQITHDICYFGDNRGTYRNNKIKKYFNCEELNTMTIGCDIPLINNTFVKKVDHTQLKNVVNRNLASLVIGDKEHENAFVTMRFYENIKFDVISFIDLDYDKNRTLFKNETLKSFNYISTKEQLISKIYQLRNDKTLINTIINLQKQEL